ncbi:MAG: outer membrane beta-barrel protein [Saprospiraceae bacterium]|nr:outer membrane beta-barrel protein [Candidatus Vicinibacter affinis]
MKNLIALFLLAFLLLGFRAKAQSGAVASIGLSLMQTDNPDVSSDGNFNHGFHLSLTTRLGKDFWYLRTGAEVHKIELKANSKVVLFPQDPSAFFLKIPAQIGARIINTSLFKVRLLAGAQLTYLMHIEDNNFNLNHDTMTDFQGGLLFGGGIDLGPFTFDINFERGLTKLYKPNDKKADFLMFSAGFFF